MTTLKSIEQALCDAFVLSIKDYNNELLKNEEDFRASYYHYLRIKTLECDDIKIHLSYTIKVQENTKSKEKDVRPDIVIFKKKKPWIAMELKITPYKFSSGKNDISKLKSLSKNILQNFPIERGYFVHIDKEVKEYSGAPADWKNNFCRELAYSSEKSKTILIRFKAGKRILENLS